MVYGGSVEFDKRRCLNSTFFSGGNLRIHLFDVGFGLRSNLNTHLGVLVLLLKLQLGMGELSLILGLLRLESLQGFLSPKIKSIETLANKLLVLSQLLESQLLHLEVPWQGLPQGFLFGCGLLQISLSRDELRVKFCQEPFFVPDRDGELLFEQLQS